MAQGKGKRRNLEHTKAPSLITTGSQFPSTQGVACRNSACLVPNCLDNSAQQRAVSYLLKADPTTVQQLCCFPWNPTC